MVKAYGMCLYFLSTGDVQAGRLPAEINYESLMPSLGMY